MREDFRDDEYNTRRLFLSEGEHVPVRILAVFLAASFALFPVAASADIPIGVLIPLTGFASAYGQQQQAAIDLFMQKYSDLGKSGKLKLITYDDRGDNTESISLTRKLIDSDQVVAIVGPELSGTAEVAFPIAVDGKTPIVTPMAAKPGIAAANRPYGFRFALTSDKAYAQLVDTWLKEHAAKPIKTVVILKDEKDAVSNNDGTNVFPGVLKDHNIRVLDTISFTTGDIDFSAQVTRAKGLNPDGIIIAGLYNEAGHVVAEARKQGMTQPIITGVGADDPRFIQIAGSAADGVMTSFDFFGLDNPNPAIAAWVKSFQAAYHQQPSNAAAEMYDTLYLMRDCIIKQGVTGSNLDADREKVRSCWAGLKATSPLLGVTAINAQGDAVRKPYILIVKDGKFIPV
jgi:branched-chain amino acid transport system substrate-binding protein